MIAWIYPKQTENLYKWDEVSTIYDSSGSVDDGDQAKKLASYQAATAISEGRVKIDISRRKINKEGSSKRDEVRCEMKCILEH